FLKLLEAQLMVYHKHSTKSYQFLHLDSIGDFNALNNLFFQILARKSSDRALDLQEKFNHIPYLNSSLFEPTDIEQLGIFVHNLDNQKSLSIYSATVLKNKQGVKKSGQIASLHYLFEFLNAYDFGGETMDNNLQESPKTLINAAVLGLIFEKINGYKDGSFFTPGFITMFVCRETIRQGVLQKFNEGFPSLKLKHFDDIFNLIPRIITKAKANELVNSLKICDPAVGSGHFLVSALNELIAVKNDLQILEDKDGKSLHRYDVEVVHDELLITDENGDIFEYIPFHKESQRLQEALFREKQTLIERCLFGVDINANSVKICRLRLWIELLKSAYYKNATELETLPNIDINIKCGNSLVSRFALNADLKQALKKSTWTIASYKQAIETYHNAQNKEQKREMETLILHIKQSFTTEIRMNDPLKNRLDKLANELYQRFTGKYLFDSEHAYETNNKANEIKRQREQAQLEYEIKNLNAKIEDIKSNKIYDQAFEWRFEFPEVLNDEGDFEGFDIIIGNPPYIQLQSLKDVADQLQQGHYETYSRTGDIYSLFYEKGNMLLKKGGFLGFITSNKWLRAGYGKATRNYLLKHTQPLLLVDLGSGVFDEATVDSNILIFKKETCSKLFAAIDFSKQKNIQKIMLDAKDIVEILPKLDENWTISNLIELRIKNKVERLGKPLKEWDITINYGIKTGFNEAFIITGAKRAELIAADPKSAEIIKPILRGRDIKRYKAEFADLWLIATFPSLKINIDNYPAIKKYLESFGKKLHQTGEEYTDAFGVTVKSRKQTHNQWFELQDSIGYYKEFQKEKIVWPSVGQTFYTKVEKDILLLDTNYFAVFKNQKISNYIFGILNSKVIINWINKHDTTLGEVAFRHYKYNFENIPIPQLNLSKQKPLISLVDKILDNKARNEDTTTLEKEIDMLVYKLYELTPEEIQYIENQ
ncbi:MAG: Eco57I restriction-modification methylase domain-containing protein, partial [Alphaproteobacteria bacterium]|nr:Eco57I restriction-modification methylase domain-containing protein [Alphaproteobacteria bacterium]